MKGSQFNTKSNRTGLNGIKVKWLVEWLVETMETKGTGWALRVRRGGAVIEEDAIL